MRDLILFKYSNGHVEYRLMRDVPEEPTISYSRYGDNESVDARYEDYQYAYEWKRCVDKSFKIINPELLPIDIIIGFNVDEEIQRDNTGNIYFMENSFNIPVGVIFRDIYYHETLICISE